ncbi:MAG TPA: class I SAM-dependent methyltransferase [Thermoanaerobaculia bacterium]|jgi:ubiquinone/menaquinone biosynthesis C-methylase UbiE
MTHNARTFRVSEVHKLEDPERLKWLPVDDVVASLDLRPEFTVADIGAGTGYFAIPIARTVRRVYAVDFQREMLDMLRAKLDARSNIELIEGEARDTKLPAECCNVVLVANVWHELEDRDEVLAEMRRIMKPRGTLAILDWRHDVERPPGPSIEHRIPAVALAGEMRRDGWTVMETRNIGRFSYLVTAQANRE